MRKLALSSGGTIRKAGDSSEHVHAWPYRKLVDMLRYKAELFGITVQTDVDERNTSCTCHACGKVKASNRKHLGLYVCSCGCKAHADVMNPMAKARGLQLGRLARRVRPHTGGPADVLRSDGVGRPSEAALDAAKLCLRRPVGLRHMPAGRTGAGGVPGIDDYHRDTR